MLLDALLVADAAATAFTLLVAAVVAAVVVDNGVINMSQAPCQASFLGRPDVARISTFLLQCRDTERQRQRGGAAARLTVSLSAWLGPQ